MLFPPPDCCASAKAPPTSNWTPTPTSCARPIANWPRRAARWQRLAQRLGVPLLPLSTQEDLVEQLRDLLEQHQPGYRA